MKEKVIIPHEASLWQMIFCLHLPKKISKSQGAALFLTEKRKKASIKF
jgi:hypothetical protein